MEHLDLAPITHLSGTVRLPGSKSISNRVLLLAASRTGHLVRHLLDSDDTCHMCRLAKLGVSCAPWRAETTLGRRRRTFPVKSADLFIGNAGTAVRPLTAVLAFSGGRYRLSGVPRMHERPIRDLVDALRGLGANIAYLGKDGFPPLEIRPGALRSPVAARVRGDVSSQYVTALLMALPLVGGGTIAIDGDLVSKPYVEMTLNLMARFGVPATRTGWSSFAVPAASYRSPGEIHVEGDASSASYSSRRRDQRHHTGGAVRVRGRPSASRATCGFPGAERWAPRCALGELDEWAHGRLDLDRARRDQSHSRCRHDGRDARPLRRWHQRAPEYRQLAREGDGSPRRHGHGAPKARRDRRRGDGSSPGDAAHRLPGGHDQHLRRPSHGHVLLARRARRRLRGIKDPLHPPHVRKTSRYSEFPRMGGER